MHWCIPAVTWHHVDAAGLDKLWQAEQTWRTAHGADVPILFVDYYALFIHPRLEAANGTLADWDNLSNDWVLLEGKTGSPSYRHAKACAQFCRHKQGCLQWFWAPGVCRGSNVVRLGWALRNQPALGSAEDGIVQTEGLDGRGGMSGWLMDRIDSVRSTQESCARDGMWITQNID